MAKVAFVFPGQGAQTVGMGKAVFEQCQAAQEVFRAADQSLGESLSQLCFEGPEDQLKLTANTQPAVLTTSIALLRSVGMRCDMAAGHSLGEYSAHVAAGTLSFEEAVQLVRKRGQFMQDAVPVGQGKMIAVLGGDRSKVEQICFEIPGVVEPVNYNCPGQLVIAGEAEAVDEAIEKTRALGAKTRPLQVSAPFHCSLMQKAEEALKPYLNEATFHDPILPVFTNVDASPVHSKEDARDALVRQVSRPVLWQQTIERMLAEDVGLFIELGPGGVLSGMIARIDKKVARVRVESPADFTEAREAIAKIHS